VELLEELEEDVEELLLELFAVLPLWQPCMVTRNPAPTSKQNNHPVTRQNGRIKKHPNGCPDWSSFCPKATSR
jgi:hypothetical protein